MPEFEHDRQQLQLILDQLHQLMDSAEPSGTSLLAQLRWELARRLFPYLTVDAMLDPHRQAKSGALLDEVRIHLKAWDSGRIASEWQTYRSETRGLVRSLQNHLA